MRLLLLRSAADARELRGYLAPDSCLLGARAVLGHPGQRIPGVAGVGDRVRARAFATLTGALTRQRKTGARHPPARGRRQPGHHVFLEPILPVGPLAKCDFAPVPRPWKPAPGSLLLLPPLPDLKPGAPPTTWDTPLRPLFLK